WLHIAGVVMSEAQQLGFRRLGVLGTKYLMESDVYPTAAAKHAIACEIPELVHREKINTIIFKELVNAVFSDESRLYFNELIESFKKRGCDAAVLGCTEIPLIVRPAEAPLPTLDSTRLLAKAALLRALSS